MDASVAAVVSPRSPTPRSPLSPNSPMMEVERPAFAGFQAQLWERIREATFVSTAECLSRHSISPHLRARMVDWITDVMLKLDCLPNSIFLAVRIMDTFFALCDSPQSQEDLLPTGLIAMFLASKYLDRCPIRLQNLYERIGFQRVSLSVLKQREFLILHTIGCNLSLPTSLDALEVLVQELGLTGVMAKSCEMVLLLSLLDPFLSAIPPARQATCALFLTYMTYARNALPSLLQLTALAQEDIQKECENMYQFLMDFPKQGQMYQSAMRNLRFVVGEDDVNPLFRFLDPSLASENRRLLALS